ncbi:MAG: PQQ-binding-like beta-propeller repeat protein [Pseudomonadales bacterium]|nr:PQQ-binding-like beta-propeller repeat protein [Pseudomonadales bacterium]
MIVSRITNGEGKAVFMLPSFRRFGVGGLVVRLCLLILGLQASTVFASCVVTAPPSFASSYSQGWGIDLNNTRYQANSTIDSSSAPQLTLKWVYGLSTDTPRSYPYVTEDTIFVGDAGRGVVALDRETGCERWVFEHEGYIASAILYGKVDGRDLLVFNDRIDGVHAIDAITGEFVWRAELNEGPIPWFSGTPLIHGNRIYVPIASQEVGLAINPLYGCCTTSGGLAAFDLATGEKSCARSTNLLFKQMKDGSLCRSMGRVEQPFGARRATIRLPRFFTLGLVRITPIQPLIRVMRCLRLAASRAK